MSGDFRLEAIRDTMDDTKKPMKNLQQLIVEEDISSPNEWRACYSIVANNLNAIMDILRDAEKEAKLEASEELILPIEF